MLTRFLSLAVLFAFLAAPAVADKGDKNNTDKNATDKSGADKNVTDKNAPDKNSIDKNAKNVADKNAIDKNAKTVTDKNPTDKNAKGDQPAADKNVKNVKNAKNANVPAVGKKGDVLAALNLPKGIDLTPEQQEQLKALKEGAAPKLAELQKQIEGEQAKLKELAAQRGAIAKDLQQKLFSLLTEEQKAKLAELKKGKGGDKNAKPSKPTDPAKGPQPTKPTDPLKGATPEKNPKNPPADGAK